MPSEEGLQIASEVFGISPTAGMLVGLAGVVQAVLVLMFIVSPLGGWALFKLIHKPSNALFLAFGLILLFNGVSGGGLLLLKYTLSVALADEVIALVTVGVASVLTLILGVVGMAALQLDALGSPKKPNEGAKTYIPQYTFDGLSFDEKRRARQQKAHDYRNRRSR